MLRTGLAIRNAAFVMGALALAACSGSSKPVEPDPNLFPKNYKAEIIITLQREVDDPTNVRDGAITEPFLTQGNRDQRYAVCVRSNSRNYNREYTGLTERIAFFYGGHLNQLIEAQPGQCAKAAFQPWPDLMNVCFSNNTCK